MKCVLMSVENSYTDRLAWQLTKKLPKVEWILQTQHNVDLSITHAADKVFVFRWPWIINECFISSGKFIGFHTSNLPDGRGGSPLHNQIIDGITSTRINAIKLINEMDAGPIYCSRHVTLQGSIDDVWNVLADLAADMIYDIITNNPVPTEQLAPTSPPYKRRKTHDLSEVASSNDINKTYRYIQMLDGEGYPRASIEVGNLVISFERASLKNGEITCDAKISVKQ